MKAKIISKVLFYSITLTFLLNTGCKKDFLDAKPRTSIVNPTTLSDFQQLLDYVNINRTSALPQLSCDDYYLPTSEDWASGQPTERNSYIWDKDLFGGQIARDDWNSPYQSIFYANSVLSGISKLSLTAANNSQYNNLRGQAYFVRAFNYFDLVKNFSPPFDASSSSKDLGVPLKLTPDVDEILPRANLQQCYDQIIIDLKAACGLLNIDVPAENRNRASRPAAYGLMSRLYLSMREYDKAEIYADSCLNLYNTILDYNTINTASSSPFPKNNDENIFWALASTGYSNCEYDALSNISIDTTLLASYQANDIRRTVYFLNEGNLVKARVGYSGYYSAFVGVATDEIYLIKAECSARRQDATVAESYLNNLLIKRYLKGTYIPYHNNSASAMLTIILKERRKELVWRDGLRWDDIRRLNKEGAGIVLKRILNGKLYTLPPNSPLYVFPIPDDEIALSNLIQNLR